MDGNSPHAVPLRPDGDIGVGGGALGIDDILAEAAVSDSEDAEDDCASSSSQESATCPEFGVFGSILDMLKASR